MKLSEIGNSKKLFTLKEANALLPLVKNITQTCHQELTPVQQKLSKLLASDPRRSVLEKEYEAIVKTWKTKIEQLGLHSSRLWLVEFDVGEGRLLWKLPDQRISVFVTDNLENIGEGQGRGQTRSLLKDYIKLHNPDWAK